MGNKFLDNYQALCKKSHLDSKYYYFEHRHLLRGGEVPKDLNSLAFKIAEPGFIFRNLKNLTGGH
jgi:hypothetical protein